MPGVTETCIPGLDNGINDTLVLKCGGDDQPQHSSGFDLCDSNVTSCIARSFDLESESVELESFVHGSPVEPKMSIQEFKFKGLRPHGLHS